MFNIIAEEKSSALLIPGWVKEKEISVPEIFGTADIGINLELHFVFSMALISHYIQWAVPMFFS